MTILIDDGRAVRIQADGVLKELLALAKAYNERHPGEPTGYVNVSTYENGREHGYYIQHASRGNWEYVPAVSFAEHRSSDAIVYYFGSMEDFEYNTHIPSETLYKNARSVPCGEYYIAASQIWAHLMCVVRKPK